MDNSKLPLVSIITPTFNSENYILETVKSVQNQTYINWELIITDDFSTDKTSTLVKMLCKEDSRIVFFQLKKNQGAAVARNNCLKHAKGKYIAFLDSDDLWLKDKLSFQIQFMQQNKFPITYASYSYINEKGIDMKKIVGVKKKIGYYDYLKNTIIGMSTAIIDKSLVSKFEFKNIRTRQDTFLWISLLKTGVYAFGLDKVLVNYRYRSNSISANKFNAARQVWKLYYDFENLGLFKSLYFFIFYALNALKKRL